MEQSAGETRYCSDGPTLFLSSSSIPLPLSLLLFKSDLCCIAFAILHCLATIINGKVVKGQLFIVLADKGAGTMRGSRRGGNYFLKCAFLFGQFLFLFYRLPKNYKFLEVVEGL